MAFLSQVVLIFLCFYFLFSITLVLAMGLFGNRSQTMSFVECYLLRKRFQCVSFNITKKWQDPKALICIFFSSLNMSLRKAWKQRIFMLGHTNWSWRSLCMEYPQLKCEHMPFRGRLASLCSKYLSFMYCHKAPPRKQLLGLKIPSWELGSTWAHLEYWVPIFHCSHTELAEATREPRVTSRHC